MNSFLLHMFFLQVMLSLACVKKPEEMTGPTIGSLSLVADESIRDIVEQEEEIFERNYQYTKLDITYLNEIDMFQMFLEDSIDAILATRPLTEEEIAYCKQMDVTPRQYPLATSALAFIRQKDAVDSNYVYENLVTLMREGRGEEIFVIENPKSGIAGELMKLIQQEKLPKHIYALSTKKEVIDYVTTHDNAIGIIDYSDISDSDNPYTKEVLQKIRLIGISRPVDSLQVGYVQPFQYNLQDRKYPFTRDLYYISRTGMSDVGMGFASFICGEIGQKIILKAGLLPKFQTERVIEINETPDIKVVK